MTSDPDLLRRWQGMASQNNTIQQSSFSSMILNGTEMKGANNMVSKQTRYTKTNRRKKGAGRKSGILTLIPEEFENFSWLDYLEYHNYFSQFFGFGTPPLTDTQKADLISLNLYMGIPAYLFSNEKIDVPAGISGWEDVVYFSDKDFPVELPKEVENYAAIYVPFEVTPNSRFYTEQAFASEYDGFSLLPLLGYTLIEGLVSYGYNPGTGHNSGVVFSKASPTTSTPPNQEENILGIGENIYTGFCDSITFQDNGFVAYQNWFQTSIAGINAPAKTTSSNKIWHRVPFSEEAGVALDTTIFNHLGNAKPTLNYAFLSLGDYNRLAYTPTGNAISYASMTTNVYRSVSKEATAIEGEYYTKTTDQSVNVPANFYTPTIGKGSSFIFNKAIIWKGDWLRYADKSAYSSYANRKLAEALVDYEW